MWRIISGVFLGWSLGANDAANIFGTGVATGTVKYRTAVLVTSVFLLIGALLEGPKCMATLGSISRLDPTQAFYCALAAGTTMTLLTVLAIPASASQAIVGTLIAVGILSGNADFRVLYKIVSCWVFTPVSSLVMGYLLFRILDHALKRAVRKITHRNTIYFWGIILAGGYGAYSLGANNVANVTGVYVCAGMMTPFAASLIGGLAISSGVLTYSRKVMMTVGKGIVPLDPFSAFVVVLAEAATLHLFTQLGVPVSSSQAVVGAVVGVGLVGNARTIRFKSLIKIFTGWVLTPISAGILAYLLLL